MNKPALVQLVMLETDSMDVAQGFAGDCVEGVECHTISRHYSAEVHFRAYTLDSRLLGWVEHVGAMYRAYRVGKVK